jgi:hypothetical protein
MSYTYSIGILLSPHTRLSSTRPAASAPAQSGRVKTSPLQPKGPSRRFRGPGGSSPHRFRLSCTAASRPAAAGSVPAAGAAGAAREVASGASEAEGGAATTSPPTPQPTLNVLHFFICFFLLLSHFCGPVSYHINDRPHIMPCSE